MLHFSRFPEHIHGHSFGKLLAMVILSAFVDEYAVELNEVAGGHNLKDFQGFHMKISEVSA